ncbi:adenosylcobinamide-GDP ribazoletransferase [Brevibacillus laterosporus]|uniref:adenosylcobinamide-GDP ribazoletransferase n=1 Tax=Brevibacillus laterosporus TaxID=1465 RepID=UPI0003B20D79|nr:adenosylcobinamide-GDP ribazoletransferase [Brevibacillus laterosporus]ERM18135.1 cobalamin synthase [Brevibacillus laterosporus PE36]
MNAFWSALTFLTRIPVRFQATEQDWYQSVKYYPYVGMVIGIFLAGIAGITQWLFPDILLSLVVIASWVYITGGLHLDGWMDTADGLGSARSRERMLEIMKDSRVGAMGVLACVLLLAVKTVSLYWITTSVPLLSLIYLLIIIPFAARVSLLGCVYFWPYLHKGKGLASGFREHVCMKHIIISIVISCLVAIVLVGYQLAIIFFVLTVVTHYLFNRMIVKQLGGLTGDTYGAQIECIEMVLLLGAVSYLYHGGFVGW